MGTRFTASGREVKDRVVAYGKATQINDPLILTAVEALLVVFERMADERIRRLEEAIGRLAAGRLGGRGEAEEYLDIGQLSKRINTPAKTIRDWVHKRKIPFRKLPTGGIRFPWSKVEAWMKGEEP
jgi:excisionase family DNA binding protein